MKKSERNIKTANSIFLNVVQRLRDGKHVNIDDYFTSSAVRDILESWFTDDIATRIGLTKEKEPVREVPVDLERQLRKMSKEREEGRYEEYRLVGKK